MPIKPQDNQRLDALYHENKGAYRGRREDYFAFLFLNRKFKLDIEEVGHQIAWGGNDYGLDAYYFDRDARNLHLYQFKWSEDHNLFKGSMERLARDGLARIFNGGNQDPNQNDVISYLKRDLKEHRELVDRVYVNFVFKGDVDAVEKSEGLSTRREDIENKVHLVNGYFGDRTVELIVDFIADKPGRGSTPLCQSYVVHLREADKVIHDDKTMHIGFVPLMDLYGMYKGLGQRFFDRNIRCALPPDNPPNRKIRQALGNIVIKRAEEPSVFAFRHNGVTIAAERVDVGHGEATLHAPRLLNGAQTVSSLARFLEEQSDNPLLRDNRDRLDAIMVLAKIIEDDPAGDFIAEVTISNNQQNPVHPWALRAMDQRQVDLADKFRDSVKIYYSRQEGAFENLSDEEREELGIEDSRDIEIRRLAQTFLAVQGDIYNMKHLPDVFESQKLYDETFKQKYLGADTRSIVLAYKVGLLLPRISNRVTEVLPLKHQVWVSKVRNLVWALVVQGLFNDKHFMDYQEWYGASLVREVNFSEDMKKLAVNKVVPILKELVANPAYANKVAQGRYEFLQSTDAFNAAMKIASVKYGWVKKPL